MQCLESTPSGLVWLLVGVCSWSAAAELLGASSVGDNIVVQCAHAFSGKSSTRVDMAREASEMGT